MANHTNSPTINFPKRVGDSTLKAEIKNTILETIHLIAPEVDMSGKTLNVILTRANTGGTSGHLVSRIGREANGGYAQRLQVMDMMVNIGRTFKPTIIHETIHYLQFQLGVFQMMKDTRQSPIYYLWDNATGHLLTSRAQVNNEQANSLNEGRSWRTEPMTRNEDGVRTVTLQKINGRTRMGQLRSMKAYLQTPHERQAHTQTLSTMRNLSTLTFSDTDMSKAREDMKRTLQSESDFNRAVEDDRRSAARWTVVHR